MLLWLLVFTQSFELLLDDIQQRLSSLVMARAVILEKIIRSLLKGIMISAILKKLLDSLSQLMGCGCDDWLK